MNLKAISNLFYLFILTAISSYRYIYIPVPATQIHGLDACAYYNDEHPVDWDFEGRTFDFADGSQYSGVVRSPNHPHYYKNNMYCSWKFVLKAGQSIVMNITEFSLFQVSRMITDPRYGKSHILKEYYQRNIDE